MRIEDEESHNELAKMNRKQTAVTASVKENSHVV